MVKILRSRPPARPLPQDDRKKKLPQDDHKKDRRFLPMRIPFY
ncbi:MAG: hypothetical protein WAO23_03460 [Dethiobacteria bacterium]